MGRTGKYSPKDATQHASVLTTLLTRLEAKYYAHLLKRETKGLSRRPAMPAEGGHEVVRVDGALKDRTFGGVQ